MFPRSDTFVTESDRVVVKSSPLNAEAAPRALSEPLTARGSHYLRAHFDAPEVDWRPTDERFRDPRTNRVMRVWEDAAGRRHYVVDEPR